MDEQTQQAPAEDSIPAPEATPTAPAQTPKGLLKALQQEFAVFREHKPLAIGIDKHLLAQKPELSKKVFKLAMRFHTQSVPYLKGLQSAETRFNLDGTPADAVTAEQREVAAQKLREYFKQRAEKHKAEKAAAAAEAAAAAAARERAEKLNQLASKFGRK